MLQRNPPRLLHTCSTPLSNLQTYLWLSKISNRQPTSYLLERLQGILAESCWPSQPSMFFLLSQSSHPFFFPPAPREACGLRDLFAQSLLLHLLMLSHAICSCVDTPFLCSDLPILKRTLPLSPPPPPPTCATPVSEKVHRCTPPRLPCQPPASHS